jgi:hypothetical protein
MELVHIPKHKNFASEISTSSEPKAHIPARLRNEPIFGAVEGGKPLMIERFWGLSRLFLTKKPLMMSGFDAPVRVPQNSSEALSVIAAARANWEAGPFIGFSIIFLIQG